MDLIEKVNLDLIEDKSAQILIFDLHYCLSKYFK